MAVGGLVGVVATATAIDFGGGFVFAVAMLALGVHGMIRVGGR